MCNVMHYRSKISKGAQINDCTRYFTISEYFKNFQFHKISAARFYFYISLVNGGWDHPFGKLSSNTEEM